MFLAEMEHSGEQLAQIDEKYRIADDDLEDGGARVRTDQDGI